MDTSRDAGSIPAASTTAHDAGTGRATSCAGLHMSQAGHTPQVADSPHVENGTARDVGPSQPGHLRNTISAQQEHNESITGEARPPDLAAVVEGYAIGQQRSLIRTRAMPGALTDIAARQMGSQIVARLHLTSKPPTGSGASAWYGMTIIGSRCRPQPQDICS